MPEVVVAYTTSVPTAFDAAVKAVQKYGYTIQTQNRESGTIIYNPPASTLWARLVGIEHTLRVRDLNDGTVEIAIHDPSPIEGSMREGSKAIGKVFHQLDKILGPGEHLCGDLIAADPASEVKRFLFVLLVFVIGGGGILFFFLKMARLN